jgi:hypothetical protein
MKYNILGILILFSSIVLKAQRRDNDFKTIEINKIVREYPDKFDLSSPLNSYLCFKYLLSQGKQGLYRSANSYKIQSFFPKENAPGAIIKEEKREAILNIKINEIIIYKDSVAGVLTDPPAKSGIPLSMQVIAFLRFEDGKWLNAGEGLGDDMNDARSKFKENAPKHLETIHQIYKLKNVSKDTASFLNYLKNKGKTPKEFILNALATHKIVVYGEIHKRKISWDLLKETINSPEFIKNAGTVFMELPSDKQDEINRFFSNEKLDSEIILNILRNELIFGWDDKGMYEFLIELWKINRKLPKTEKINVVLVDSPKPFDSLANLKEFETYFANVLDRNEQMAKIIFETVKNKKDLRNSLFIVGAGHAYKSLVPDLPNDGRQQKDAKLSAVAQLVQLFSDKDVFTIFSHCAIISNNGSISGKIRNGLFDTVFAKAGNKPVGFELKNSPFGKEYFDGLSEIAYSKENRSFDHVYDGYLFLQPLEEEQDQYLLYDMFSDKYVEELKRRAIMLNEKVQDWYDVKEVTKEAIIANLKKCENQKRWMNL